MTQSPARTSARFELGPGPRVAGLSSGDSRLPRVQEPRLGTAGPRQTFGVSIGSRIQGSSFLGMKGGAGVYGEVGFGDRAEPSAELGGYQEKEALVEAKPTGLDFQVRYQAYWKTSSVTVTDKLNYSLRLAQKGGNSLGLGLGVGVGKNGDLGSLDFAFTIAPKPIQERLKSLKGPGDLIPWPSFNKGWSPATPRNKTPVIKWGGEPKERATGGGGLSGGADGRSRPLREPSQPRPSTEPRPGSKPEKMPRVREPRPAPSRQPRIPLRKT